MLIGCSTGGAVFKSVCLSGISPLNTLPCCHKKAEIYHRQSEAVQKPKMAIMINDTKRKNQNADREVDERLDCNSGEQRAEVG